MSSVNKRAIKPAQRLRKKPPTHHPKLPMTPSSSSSEIGLFSSPHLTYQFVRCFMGNIGEVSTSTHNCVGVIKAVDPNGGFGMKFVRSAPRGSDKGPFNLEEDKVIPLCDIRKIIVRNVNPMEAQKDEIAINEEPYQIDDPEICLQHYFSLNDDAEAFSLTSDEQFPPEAMFEINKQKYNVTSSYRESLEGYTVPLDKTDPEFKAKEEYYTKIAKEIEDNKCLSSAWEGMVDGEADNEELKFSAVLQDGIRGRELKSNLVRANKRGNRGNNRATLREYSETQKRTEVKPLNPNLPTLQDQIKSSLDLTSKPLSDALEGDSPKAPHESYVTTDAAPSHKEKSKSTETVIKKEDKNGFLDPNAPEFKPSGLVIPPEPPSASFNSASYSQSVPGFAVTSHQALPIGGAPPVPFNLSSSVPCMLPSAIAPQFPTLRHPQMGFSQQLAMASQQLSASGTLSNQPIVAQSVAGSRGLRQSVAAGNYSKQRPPDQANSGSQHLPFSIFTPHGFPFVPSAPYPIGVPFISTAAGNFHPSAFSGMHSLTSALSQISGQQSSATSHPTQPPPGQLNHMQPNSQPITSSSQVQGAQFQTGYNPPFGNVQVPAGVAAYSQYSTGQLIGPQAAAGPLSYYPQPVYQSPGLIPFPIQQMVAGNHPQLGSQLHNQGQQSLIPTQPLQLQPPQQQGAAQSVQQQPHHIFFASPYHLSPQQMLAQAVAMGVSHQGVQNTFNIPQNVHPQHPVQLYISQQPNNTG